MSLLFVGNQLSGPGRNQGISSELASRLRGAGFEVITASSRSNKFLRLLDMLATIWLHRKEYQAVQVDVFSGPAFTWAEASSWALRLLRKPYVLTLHGGNLPAFACRWPGRVRSLLASAAVVTAPSRYLQEQMRAYRGDILLLPNPVDIAAYPFRLRQNPDPHLVWLRAFHSIYNPTLAPRMLAQLIPDFPGVTLAMFGPDKGDGSLQAAQKAAQELRLAKRITFPGGIPKAQVPKSLNQADIFINTTNFDNTPISVIEAMACGLCIVSTNVGGLPYLLEDGQDALLVPPDDPGAMAAAVRRILCEPSLAECLSANARRKAGQFDWAVVLPQWENLFVELGGT